MLQWRQRIGKLSLDVVSLHHRNAKRLQSTGTALQSGEQLLPAQTRGFPAATTVSPALLARARAVAREHETLAKQLRIGFDAGIAKRVGELTLTARVLNEWDAAQTSIAELEKLLQDPSSDQELRSLASDEIATTLENLPDISTRLQSSLIPAHPFAELSCLLEIRPGVGGSEAGLFAGDLLRMYQAYCKHRSLRANLLKLEHENVSGAPTDSLIKEAILEVASPGAYSMLRSEGGVHRVQRVPATESKGRTHTSAVAVYVMPGLPSNPADELGEKSFDNPESDYYVNPGDVRTDLMRAGGAGGQHVNKTESAVRLTHLPTGTVVAMQDSRSQHENRAKAWQILRAKIAQQKREAREEELAQLRLSMVGIAKTGRGDKVRTYNWSQQRVTDHRSGITLHHLDDILQGGHSLDTIMDSVKGWLRERDIQALIADQEAAATKK